MTYLLHVHYAPSGVTILAFTSAFSRALAIITLTPQPVTLRTEDR